MSSFDVVVPNLLHSPEIIFWEIGIITHDSNDPYSVISRQVYISDR